MIYRRVKPNDDDDVVDIHQWSYFPKVELSYIGFFIIYENSQNFLENKPICKKSQFLDNFSMTNILTIFKIWESAIWHFFYFPKYNNSHFFAILRCLDLYYIFHYPKFQPLELVLFEIWQSEYDNFF